MTALALAISAQYAPNLQAAAPEKDNYHFTKASVIDRVILAVIEDYYDPKRVDPERMFKAIMDALQKGIAELVVTYDDARNLAKVSVASSEHHTLNLSEMKSPWRLSREIRRVFKFIAANLPTDEYDFRELEYGAANAMLSTLDPHSNALPPDIYKYLRMDTAGAFGGLGIRITTDRRPPCLGNLTVVEVFDDTPADKAGMKVGDQIIRIDDESTVNITTSEAADRLRGVPGTKVDVQVKRASGVTQTFTITRRMVPIKSVEWQMLKDKVGYIKLTAFQENSAEEMLEALERLHKKKMKGLVLDLRGNPGGLLHIAINIANNFLPSGTIVTTAGRTPEDRHVENATAEGTEPAYPMVVLIDAYSASAAEIMAGALRNHGRALLIGETTFGKGSVQMVQQIPDGGAIKLTSGQYLTPGDISIQAVGVPPDITFRPVSVDADEMDISPNDKRFSEADLEHHLDRPNIRARSDRAATADATLYVPRAEVKADQARYKRCYVDESDDTTFKGRYETEFARRLIAAAARNSAEELLVQARLLLEKEGRAQEKSIVSALKKLKVDWSRPPTDLESGNPDKKSKSRSVSASAKIIGKVVPGQPLKVKVTVTNNSKETIYRLLGVSESDNPILAGVEFVFGKVAPKKSRTWTETISLPMMASPRVDDMKIVFHSVAGPAPEERSISVTVPARQSPELLYGWQFQDIDNRDGIFEPGEELLMFVAVKNAGKGETIDTEVELSAKPGVDVIQGLFDIGTLKPGQTAEGVLRLRINQSFPLSEVELSLAIRDWYESVNGLPATRTLMEREILLPVSTIPNKLERAEGVIAVSAANASPVALRESPSDDARIVAMAKNGAAFQTDATAGDFFRIELSEDRFAWIEKTTATPGAAPAPDFTPHFYEPPGINIKGSRVRRVTSDRVTIEGVASHPAHVRDIMVFADDQKVLYVPNTGADDKGSVAFSAEVPLKEGANHVVVIARHDDKLMGTESLFIRREK